MRGQHVFMGLALLATTALGACGTVANGGTQTVDVVVKGSPTAYCTFTTSKFRNSASFPNKLTLERSKENLHADCQGEQNRKVVFDVPARMTKNGSLGNIVYGVLPGMAYDSATGALWEYPNPLIVDFRAIGEGAQVEWPDNKADADLNATTRGTAPIVTPQPLRMQPVLDEDLNPAAPAIKAPAPVSMVPMKANAEPEVIDAATLAIKNKGSASPAARMTPVTSPEDKMGADPAKVKAQAAAKAKAAEDAKRKAAEKAAAKKKADAEAKAAAAAKAEAAKAEATAAPAQMLPETSATAPGETPAATTTTTTTTTVVTPTPAPAADVVMPAPVVVPAPATTSSTTTTTTTTAPAAEAPKDDMDKYLDGGQ